MLFLIIMNLALVFAVPATDSSFKDQSCTDPRTLKKHPAYTEWADAYSCTRHRCQPGGRNLAIYTVGCKHVEAPESAIECEEVVEDTNMQFPFCCTRLRCLVVVGGEVWTKVLGQPWETLPAAPWSHMYKMKKPPPGDAIWPKGKNEGPIYELTSELDHEESHEVMRATQKKSKDCPEGREVSPPATIAAPDIVIALSTTSEQKAFKKTEKRSGGKRPRKSIANNPYMDEETPEHHKKMENEEADNEKAPDVSEEKLHENTNGHSTGTAEAQELPKSWTEIPPTQWSEHELDAESPLMKAEELSSHLQPEYHQEPEKEEKPSDLKALVDAIGTRMRDIENVVQKMSEKVQQVKPEDLGQSAEKGVLSDPEDLHHKEEKEHVEEYKVKKPRTAGDHYKRFAVRTSGSKYLHGVTDTTSEPPLFIEDNSMNGYFADASNSVLRRGSPSPRREPPLTYMAPVETRRKSNPTPESEESDQNSKNHIHKKKRTKGKKDHKKHHSNTRKRYNRLNSAEIERNVVSLEDSAIVKK